LDGLGSEQRQRLGLIASDWVDEVWARLSHFARSWCSVFVIICVMSDTFFASPFGRRMITGEALIRHKTRIECEPRAVRRIRRTVRDYTGIISITEFGMAVRFTLRRQSNTAEERAVVEQLGNVLAGLPAPWSVIVNEHPRQPPWVRYLAFHRDKGLALLDVASSRPESKVGRVTSLFTRAGFGAFEQGSLPLIAIGIGKFQIEALEFCLDTAFQSVRCGLTIADWPEQAIALLLERSGMNLKRLVRTNLGTQMPVGEATVPPVVTDAPEAAEERAPVHAAPPDPVREPPASIEEPDPVHAAPPKPVRESPVFRAEKRRPEPPPLRLQAEPRRGARAQYDLPHARPRRRIIGTAAVAAGAAVAAYAYFVMPLPAPKIMPPVATQPRSTPQVAAVPSAVPKQDNTAAPAPENKAVEEAAKLPSTPADISSNANAETSTSARTAAAPPSATPPVPSPAPTVAGTSVENLPPPLPKNKAVEEAAKLPSTPADTSPNANADTSTSARTAAAVPSATRSAPTVAGASVENLPPPLPNSTPPVSPSGNAQPEQLAAIPAPPPPPPKPHIQHDTTRAESQASPMPDDELVMINGLTYVNGRQPHSLGTVAIPADRSDASNSSASEWNVLVAPSVQAQP